MDVAKGVDGKGCPPWHLKKNSALLMGNGLHPTHLHFQDQYYVTVLGCIIYFTLSPLTNIQACRRPYIFWERGQHENFIFCVSLCTYILYTISKLHVLVYMNIAGWLKEIILESVREDLYNYTILYLMFLNNFLQVAKVTFVIKLI